MTPYYPYYYSDPDFSQMIPVLVTLCVILAFVVLVGLACYILQGIAIYSMSKRRGIQNGILGFIPVARDYQLGTLAGEIHLGKKTIKSPGLWLVIVPIIYGTAFTILYVLMMIPIVMLGFAESSYGSSDPGAMLAVMMVAIVAFVLVAIAGQTAVYALRGLVLHKLFSHYHPASKPVLYMMLSIFIPLVEPILLFRHRNRPLLDEQTPDAPPVYAAAAPAPAFAAVPGVSPYPPQNPAASQGFLPYLPQDSIDPAAPAPIPADPAAEPPADTYNPDEMHDNW